MRYLYLGLILAAANLAASEWPQWGGPNRDFVVATPVAAKWPDSGPKQLWTRTLGEGYSSVVGDGKLIYTMYRRNPQEVVIAMDAKTGVTKWEYAYNAEFLPGMAMENGPGPHSTPLLLGNILYTIGIRAEMHAFDKNTGKVLWRKDLYKDFPGSTKMERGYSSSPMAYKNTILVMVGGANHAIVALNPKDGSAVWSKQTFNNTGSSPIVINVDGQDQLVVFFADEIVGMDPSNGALLWTHKHSTNWGLNISVPIWGPGNVLFLSSAYNGGARALKLAQSGGKTTVTELWKSNRMRLHHGNAIRIGDTVYGSSGDFGPAPLTAVNVKTGAVQWQDRTFSKANFVLAGGKLIVADEDGTVAMASVSPEGLKVISQAQLLNSNVWTAPALVDTTLYLRDRKNIMALDLK